MISVRKFAVVTFALVISVIALSCSDSPTEPSTGSWVLQSSGTTSDLHAVWSAGPENAWAVGAAGTILHFDGTAWTPQTSGTSAYLWGISGSSDSDIFAVGAFGVILHFNGTDWQSMPSGTAHTLASVVVIAPNNVYVSGELGTILHYDGSTWQPTIVGPYAFVAGIGGGTYRVHPAVGASFTGVAALTTGGVIYLNDGYGWGDKRLFVPIGLQGSIDLWVPTWQDVFVATAGAIVWVTPSGRKIFDTPSASALQGICGNSLTDIYAVGGGMIHFDGTKWSPVNIPTTAFLYDVWLRSSTEGFAVGKGGAILRLQ